MGARIKRGARFVLPASWEEREEKRKYEPSTNHGMPVKHKLLQGVIMKQHLHTNDDKTRALKAGFQAHQEGKSMGDYPPEFLPKMGDSVLFDNWTIGFKASALADGMGAD